MKISIIGPGLMPIPPMGWGAIEILIWDYHQELIRLGHDVKIVNTPNSNEIIQQVNEFDPDFVHLQYEDYFSVLDNINCKNTAVTSHYGYLEQPNKYGGYARIMKGFINGNFRIFCLSEGIKNTYISLGCDPTRLDVTPNGARSDLFFYTDKPAVSDRSMYLAKITDRKRQYLYQHIPNLYFAGNKDDNRFDFNSDQYLGEWSKEMLYANLTHYSNLVLLSDGEADPLVTKEAMMAGLGVVVSSCSIANLDLTKPFISVIPEHKALDIQYVKSVINKNRIISNEMRLEIRQYAIDNFSWKNLVQKYVELI